MLRVLIAGGGTGGHLFPGIAVAQELERRAGARVRFVGSSSGIERTAVPRAGYPVDLLEIRGVRGEGLRGLARAAWQVPVSLVGAWRLLRRERPHVVIGVGGYASFPAVAAALVARVPVLLLEQNATPGLATRLLAPFAARVCVSFPETAGFVRGRTVVTGNPVRGLEAQDDAPHPASPASVSPASALPSGAPSSQPARPAGATDASTGAPSPKEEGAPAASQALGEATPLRVLVFGGSAGAHHLNLVLPHALARIGRPVEVAHQTGERDRETVVAAYRELGVEARVVAFIDDMLAEYRRADLVICRSGATTIAELTALGIAAVLIPYPFAAGDHQRYNAQALVRARAAEMVLDRELAPETMAALLARIAADPLRLAEMRARARSLGRPQAAALVVEQCLAVARCYGV